MIVDPSSSDLDAARLLATAGIPIFLARAATPDDPERAQKLGFVLPSRWQTTAPDASIVDNWRPGMALCAVMGRGLDLIDLDPRGFDPDQPADATDMIKNARAYAIAQTPSGGLHLFVRSLGVGSRDGVFPGIDVKGGLPDGTSRGFAFIAPTVKISKETGEPAPYRWHKTLDPDEVRTYITNDNSGAELAARVRELRGSKPSRELPADQPEWLRGWATQKAPQSDVAAHAAIERALEDFARVEAREGSGYRTDLMKAAYVLGGYVGAGVLDEDGARDRLLRIVDSHWGQANEDDKLWVEQGLSDGQSRPFEVVSVSETITAPPGAPAAPHTAERPVTLYDWIGSEQFDPEAFSDQEAAELALARTWPGLRVAFDTGQWLIRTRDVWEESHADLSDWVVTMLTRLMPPGRKPETKEDESKRECRQYARRKRWTSTPGRNSVSSAMRAVVKGEGHYSAVRLSSLDEDPEILWAGGLPYDLRASSDDLIVASRIDPGTPHLRTARYAPADVPTPLWDQFVQTVLPDEAVRDWALTVLSVALAGYPDAALPVLYGPERTGKSQLIALIADLLGNYAHAADPRLLAGAENAHASVIYALKGRRLSFIDEGPRRGHMAAERLKQLTGGADLTGNAMRANPITFRPTHTLVMTTNDEPQITDGALRARMRIIPCESDRELVRRTRADLTPAVWQREAPGVLAQFMRRTAAWLADRSIALNDVAPLSLRIEADELAAGQDPVLEWLEECTAYDEVGTRARTLYRAFGEWFGDHPAHRRKFVPTETAWGRRLNALGIGRIRRNDGNYRQLRVRLGGGPIGPRTADAGAVTGLVTGSGEFGSGPVTVQNPSSNPVSTSAVDSVTSFMSSTTTTSSSYIYKPTRDTTQEIPGINSEKPVTSHDLAENRGSPAKTGSVKGSADPPTLQSRLDQMGDVASSGLSRTRLKAEKMQVKRQLATETAQGVYVGLPAIKRRRGAPLSATYDEVKALVAECMQRSGHVTVDVESTGYDIGHPEYGVRTVQLGDDDAAAVLDPADDEARLLIEAALAAAPEIVAHNLVADLAPLAHLGLIDYDACTAKTIDTAVISKLADPRSGGGEPGLKDAAPAVLGDRAEVPAADAARDALFKAGGWLKNTAYDTPVARSGWAQVSYQHTTMINYAASDVLDASALRKTLPLPPDHVLRREQALASIVARTALWAADLDADHVQAQLDEREPLAARYKAEAQAFGVANPGSPKQLLETLHTYDLSIPDTKKETLEPLVRQGGPAAELASAVLRWREQEKLLSTYLRKWHVQITHGDGRARSTVYTVGADTGRMTSNRDNCQNIPRKGGVRECWRARPGKLWIAADFSSVEVRVAAALSQDPTLIQFVMDGRDLHGHIASLVWGPDYADEQRTAVKRGVFGRLYGGAIDTLARQVGVDHPTMQRVIDTLDSLTPGLKEWSENLKRSERYGVTQFPTYSGRIIHLPRGKGHAWPNYAIQGTARELFADAVLKWEDSEYGGGVVIPVHDEIVAEVDETTAVNAIPTLVRCMTTELYGIPIVAEPWDTPSKHWHK